MNMINVESITVPGQQQHQEVFPAVLATTDKSLPLNEFTTWIEENRDMLIQKLASHGAILFRGFPIKDAHDFDSAIRAFGMPSFTYEESLSNAVRVNKTDIVFTANEAPPDVSIYLHHELAQTPLFPSRLFFCCETAPSSDGETPLCRSDVVLSRLAEVEPSFVEDCERLGVRYINTMPAEDDPLAGQGRSWRSTRGVDSRDEAEARLSKLGYSFEWQADGSLRAITPSLPAIRTLVGGRRVFFNQLIAAFRGWRDASKSITFGDGSAMPIDAMENAIQLADELSFDLALLLW